ncbi:hypothetical protein EMIT053CA3_10545 [Pseudomonas donghuensis]
MALGVEAGKAALWIAFEQQGQERGHGGIPVKI